MRHDERYFLDGFERAVRVLEALKVEGRPLRLSEISERVQIPTTSTHRILSTMEQLEFIVRDADTRRFRLGPKLLDLGLALLNSLEPRHVALPFMEKLAKDTGETVNLVVMAKSRPIIAEIVDGKFPLAVRRRVGYVAPLNASSSAKVLLAHLPETHAKRLLRGRPLPTFTKKTKSSIRDLLKELERVRRVGYALNDEESTQGVRGVGAPVYDVQGRVVAALSLVGPTLRVPDKRFLEDWPQIVVRTADAISSALGYRQNRAYRKA